jgi:Holliday junction resolvase RusA-like endonuclease
VPVFEFVVEGPAVSLRASIKSRRRYQKWVMFVRDAAQSEWPGLAASTSNHVEVVISNYYTAIPPDVDNIIKPILDALKTLVYTDDQQVYKVTSQKLALSAGTRIDEPGPILAEALRVYTELLHIVVIWEELG